jgi:hypothetical protein
MMKAFVAIGLVAVVGGGYYMLNSGSRAELATTAPSGKSLAAQEPQASGKDYCGNWPSQDINGISYFFAFPGSIVPPIFPSTLPIPLQTSFIGGSHKDRQPIILTAADADKGARGMGTYFFCSDLSPEEAFYQMKANSGIWRAEGGSLSPGRYALMLDRIVDKGQDYTAGVNIFDVGEKTLISFTLGTFY